MLAERNRFHVVADAAGYERGAASFAAALDASHVAGRLRYYAELVFEEIVMNIIRHGYHSDGVGRVDVAAACTPDEVVVSFEDAAEPFDPLSVEVPAVPATLAEAPDGGRGILLVRKLARLVEYEQLAGGRNRLTVTIGGA